MYYPWLRIRDPLDDAERLVPPSGHMAASMPASTRPRRAQGAGQRSRPWRAGLEPDQQGEQDILNPRNINVIRDFRETAASASGARACITSDADWKYVNVRRLFIFLEESMDEGTQWVVFEPNDEPCGRGCGRASPASSQRLADGALDGARPEEAFFVKCDRTTMTQDDIDNGRLIMLIGVAPVKPAEFVIIRIGQWAGGPTSRNIT